MSDSRQEGAGLIWDELRQKLDDGLERIDDPRKLVGQHVPEWAEEWAIEKGLDVVRTEFAPPGKLFLMGAFPIPDLYVSPALKGETR